MDNPTEHIAAVTTVQSDAIASIIVAALDRAGISSTATGGFTSGAKALAPGWVRVMVAEADLPVAKNTLAKMREENEEIDWSQVDLGEPES